MIKTLLSLIVLFLSAGALGNPQSESSDLFALSLQELMKVKVKVASRSPQTVDEAGSTVSVFSRDEISALGIGSMYQLLELLPGFEVGRDGGIGHLSQVYKVRGTTSSGQVLLIIDGHRMNPIYLGDFEIISFELVPLENIEQVEIIRGPGSAMYGGNAFSAVINVVTNRTANRVAAHRSSFDGWRSAIELSKEFESGGASLFAKAFVDDGDDYTLTDINNTTIDTSDPRDGYDINASAWWKDVRADVIYSKKRHEDFYVFSFLGNDVNSNTAEMFSGALEYRVKPTPNLDLVTRASYLKNTWDVLALFWREGTEIIAGMPFEEDVILGGEYATRDRSVSLDASYTLSAKHKINAGLFYVHSELYDHCSRGNHNTHTLEFVSNSLPCLRGADSFTSDTKRINRAAYLQDQYEINNQWSSVVGLRYDEYSDVESSSSPRLAIIYQKNERNRFKAMYGEAFKPPNFEQLALNAPRFIPPENIGPEQVATTEFAWLNSGDTYNLVATLFQNEISDIISTKPVNDAGDFTWTNTGDRSIEGLELELMANTVFGATLRLSYTTLFSGEDDLSTSRYGSWVLNWQTQRWAMSWFGTWNHGRSEIAPDQGPYWLHHASANYRVLENVDLQISVNNLFDEDYLTASAPAQLNRGVENRGRSWAIGATVRF